MNKISKETWFVICFTPVVIAVMAFVLLSGGSDEPDIKEAKVEKTEVNSDPLVQKLFEEDESLESPLEKESRMRHYKSEEEKYSVGDLSIYDDFSKEEPEAKPSDQVTARSIPSGNISKPKKRNMQSNNISEESPKEKDVQAPVKTLQNRQNSFYSSKTSAYSIKPHAPESEFVNAVVHNEHSVKSGNTIRLRITEETQIGDVKIPANTYISGIATFTSERILLNVTSININGKLIKTSLMAYDTDGIEGIYVPGGIMEEISQDGINQTVNQTTVNLPVVGGITTNALSKKANDPVVKVPSGYQVLLKKKDQQK